MRLLSTGSKNQPNRSTITAFVYAGMGIAFASFKGLSFVSLYVRSVSVMLHHLQSFRNRSSASGILHIQLNDLSGSNVNELCS